MEKAGITTGKFIAGIVIAILVSSAVSAAISTQLLVTGPQGPQGETGATGATGPEGPPGPRGPYLPDYDSGWVDITDKAGSSITLTHGLGGTDIIVDVTGLMTQADAPHQFYLGLTGYMNGFEETCGRNVVGYSLVETNDGGYALCGYTSDVYLVKTNALGYMLWNKTYGGTYDDRGHSVVQTSDGGYAIGGITSSFGAGSNDVYLVKTDAAGSMLWNKTYGGASQDIAFSMVQTTDGGYAIGGFTHSFGAGGYDLYLVKTDAAGNMLWNQTYGGTSDDVGYSVVQTDDGGYAICGETGADVYLVKTDTAGAIQWSKTYGGTGVDSGHCVVQTHDGGYAIGGLTYSFGAGGDVYLVKTDAAGNMLWNKTYGGTNVETGYSLVQTSDGGYAISGSTYSFGAGARDVYLVKTDSLGNMQWSKTYGGTYDDIGYSLVQTWDGGYAIGGLTYSFGAGSNDVYLVKTAVESGLAWTATANTITLCRGVTDTYWNYVRVRIWKID